MLVGVDVGGTFTDFVGFRDGEVVTHKVPSAPRDPGGALLQGIRALGGTAVAHGTTIATNAILERRGARTALVTTAGFEDLLIIGRQNRPSLYDWRVTRTPPVLPRGMAVGARERMGPNGRALKRLSPAEVRRIVKVVRAAGAESVAVCLLFSFANPRHEEVLRSALEPVCDVSISSRVHPEFREYERASTTALDAYVKPLVRKHLATLEAAFGSRFLVMKSGGGTADSHQVLERPIELALSGPAGGVSAAVTLGRRLRIQDLITFDMGGTSADFSVILGGQPTHTNEATVEGLPLAFPALDIESIGAGGGSLASRDAGGALRVGPGSAGAEPGPMCYGRGGTQPTVTDADLLAGLLPDAFLGGAMPLRKDLAGNGLEIVARGMHLSTDEAILRVRHVVESTMVRGMKTVLARRGLDPRDFPLMAFGGAGPVHAAFIAAEIVSPRVLVPFLPGSFSAYGILTADLRLEYSQGLIRPLRGAANAIHRIVTRLRAKAIVALQAQRLSHGIATFLPTADLRFVGQSYEINVPIAPPMEAGFRREHRRRYGYASPSEPVEVVAVRLAAIVQRPKAFPRVRAREAPRPETRRVLFDDGWRRSDVWRRTELPLSFESDGPAIIEEDQATTVVPPGWRFRVLRHGVLELEGT
ncbi:MAG: hydantoinase/oxoprolinase family protein [Methanobacteriota archaeon]|nr:MAG: hydantoinase/oxoprolinase family protein [Euryarchaeota archaeon]